MTDKLSELGFANLGEVLDVSTWKETQQYGCVHGPICPSCQQLLPTHCAGPQGVGVCTHCRQHFRWFFTRSPLGQAYTTEALKQSP